MTGYPADLLEPDLDLEADLGVDTVKQAEVFAAVREHYNLERDPNLKLRDFPTLRHVAGWIRGKAGIPWSRRRHPSPPRLQRPPSRRGPGRGRRTGRHTDEVTQKVIDIVAQLTGYPADLLDPDLDLEADLGVDTVKQAEVFAAVREHYNVERDDTMKLRDFPTIKHVAGWIRGKAGIPEPTAALRQRHRPRLPRPRHTPRWLPRPRRRRSRRHPSRPPRSRPARRQALTR
jgi:acyl carrier protein